MDIEQLAEQVLQAVDALLEERLAPVLADIAAVRLEVAGAGYLKAADLTGLARADAITPRLDDLTERVKTIAADVAARPTLDVIRAEQAVAAGKAAADIATGIRVPQDGKSVTVEDVRPLIEQMVAAIPRPKDGSPGRDGVDGKDGRDGKDGIDGKDAQPGKDGRDGVNGKDGAPGRDGVDGKPGANGADGAPGRDGKDGAPGEPGPAGKDADLATLRDIVSIAVKAAVADIPTPKDGEPGKDADPVDMQAVARMIEADVRRAVDALPRPKDGADGMSIDDFDLDLKDDGRTLVFRFGVGERTKTFEIVAPWQLYRGVFKGDESYTRGDTCTYGGSQWVAMKDNPGKPGDPGSGWQLCVKRGANA